MTDTQQADPAVKRARETAANLRAMAENAKNQLEASKKYLEDNGIDAKTMADYLAGSEVDPKFKQEVERRLAQLREEHKEHEHRIKKQARHGHEEGHAHKKSKGHMSV